MPVSMPPRTHSPQAIVELQGVEFARVLSLVEHFQRCSEQHLLVWDGQQSTPTPTPAATSATYKQRSCAAGRRRADNCSKHMPDIKSRRYRSESGLGHARLSSSRRAHAPVADPGYASVQRSTKPLQRKLLHCMAGAESSSCKGGSYDSSNCSSSVVSLAVDCTAIVDVPTSTDNWIPAVYDCIGEARDHSPELCSDSSEECTLDSSSSNSNSSTSSSDTLTAALWERVQDLEHSNRVLDQTVQQLQAEIEQQQQKQIADEQLQGGSQPQELQICMLPVASIIAGNTPPGALPEAAAPAAAVAECCSDSSSCFVVAAPPSPTAASWPPVDEQQQQQQQAEHVGITIDILPACEVPSQQQPAEQQPQSEQPDTARLFQVQLSQAGHSVECSYDTGSSKAQLDLPAATHDLQQAEQQYVSTIMSLQREVSRLQMLQRLQQTDYEELEFVLKESEKQRREYAARYAFVVLDHDNDGYISTDQVERYELFASYAPEVLSRAFQHWRWQSGFPGYLNMEDFVRFVEYADDRSTRASQRFWFAVLDADGDGHLGWQDMRQAYEAVDTSSASYIIGFENLMNQIRDMVEAQQQPELGFTCAELCGSKLGAGVIALLTNHNNMLLQRSTAEWGRGDFPL